MATIRELVEKPLEVQAKHTEVEATYSVVQGEGGETCLQIDTYGSKERAIPGKKSQSLRFTPEALRQLRDVLSRHFGM